ncbi:MAG: ATP-dependent zinc metalloprotease FtsH [Anaerolineae bacterium]
MSRWFRNGTIYLIILAAFVILLVRLASSGEQPDVIAINNIAKEAREGSIEAISVASDEMTLKVKREDGSEVLSRKEPGVPLLETLERLGVTQEVIDRQGIQVSFQPERAWDNWMAILGSLLPLLLFGALIFFLFRQAQGGTNQALSFGRSRAKMISGDKPTVTFDDVAGVEEAKQELEEVVDFLCEPEKFIALGARIPKGVLMVGPPGCGKTLMARAVAGEAGVPFFSISGSEFVEMFVGVGASRVRDLFDQAKKHSPCIVFIDEIDAVGRHRGTGLGGSHDEREQTLNQILVEMDGFGTDTNVIIMAATNRPDILDPALLRPGRFDRRVVIDRPDMRGRRKILDIHVRGKPLARDVDLEAVAKQTPGFSGADIENLVNEAAILAARRNGKSIAMEDMQEAIERVIAGPERKSRLISEEEREIIAYHEAGHALVMHRLANCDPVHKVSIVSRGMALGYTMPLPQEDRYLRNKAKFEDDLAGLLGGRAAEEIVFGDVTTGASNDLERVTKMARSMVTQYGMSEKLGPLQFGEKEELVFLGREIGEQRNYSEAVAHEIDLEIKRIVTDAHERAKAVLIDNRDKLTELADRLIQVESVDAADFEALMA